MNGLIQFAIEYLIIECSTCRAYWNSAAFNIGPTKKVFCFSSPARVTPRGQNKNAIRSSSYIGNHGLYNSG